MAYIQIISNGDDPMTLTDAIAICEAYAKLGTAIQQQVKSVVIDGEDPKDQNEQALRMARRSFIDVARLRGVDVSSWDDAFDEATS